MDFNVLSLEMNPHIILTTETWFTERSAPCLSNYGLFRRDRIDYHGGVAFYIRSVCLVQRSEILPLIHLRLISDSFGDPLKSASISSLLDDSIVHLVLQPEHLMLDETLYESISEDSQLVKNKYYSSLLKAGDFNFP